MKNFKKLIGVSLAAGALAVGLSGQASADEIDYTVQAGDTLSKIAIEHFGSSDYVQAIADANGITDVNMIYVGQTLTLDVTNTGESTVTTYSSEQSVANTSESATVSYSTDSYTNTSSSGSVVLSNGNTAGTVGTYAAQQMAAATGVDATTWETIIARESNGDVNAYNASGASGLFQTMPGWGSTATVDDQIQSAINAYNAQGLSAWGF